MFHKVSLCFLLQYTLAVYGAGLLKRSGDAVPIQMDMRADGSLTICTGLTRYINCRDGSSIAITSAFWGRVSDKICPSDDGDPVTDCEASPDTLNIVRNTCEGKKECQLEAKHSKLQNNNTQHCPGVNKYLTTSYICIPDSKGVTICESSATNLTCPAQWTIQIADVFWGRRPQQNICGSNEGGNECENTDHAASHIKAMCNGTKRCLVQAEPNLLEGNSGKYQCSISKYLMVNYICNPSYTNKKAEVKDDSDDSKLLQDTSSKELMGLLEKHLNEIKAPEAKQEIKQPAAAVAKTFTAEEKKGESSKFVARNKGVSPSPGSNSPKTKTRSTLEKKTNTPFVATEDDDEFTNSILNGPSFTRSLHPVKDASHAAIRKDETPTAVKEDKSTAINTNMVKDTVPKAEGEFEISEPSTVRSILARAKEVLKTLDSEPNSIDKRTGIARNDAANAATQVANLAQSLASTNKVVKKRNRVIQQAVEAASLKPRTGIPRSLNSVDTTRSGGFGNTP